MDGGFKMKEIAAAFVKAQAAFGPALKTSNNPFFKSKYADLGNVIEAVIDALHANGIALVQCCHESETGVIVETVFVHESGEQMSCGKFHVPAAKNDPQGYGSALTYARRYGLMAACGIAPEDDDGNAASKAKPAAKPEAPVPESAKSVGKSDFDKLPQDRQSALTDLSIEIADEFKANGEEKAYDMYAQARDGLPLIEEQAALRSLIPSQMKTAFTKIYNARNAQAKPQGTV